MRFGIFSSPSVARGHKPLSRSQDPPRSTPDAFDAATVAIIRVISRAAVPVVRLLDAGGADDLFA